MGGRLARPDLLELHRPRATLMRHFFRRACAPQPVRRLPARVREAAATASLVAPAGCPQAPPPRRLAARPRAVPVPPIAERADVDRALAGVTEETATVRAQSRSSGPGRNRPNRRRSPRRERQLQALSGGGRAFQRDRPPRFFRAILSPTAPTRNRRAPRAGRMSTYPETAPRKPESRASREPLTQLRPERPPVSASQSRDRSRSDNGPVIEPGPRPLAPWAVTLRAGAFSQLNLRGGGARSAPAFT
jgi:hypothetical protein